MKKVMITNRQLAKSELMYKQAAASSNANVIIFREKWATEKQAKELICGLQQVIDPNNTRLVINHHHQLALELGINYLHFSFEDYKRKERWIKSLKGRNIKCGVSIHSIQQLEQIDESLVDYLLVGTIFPTTCKPGIKTQGIAGLKEITCQTRLPIIVIGGITQDNIHLLAGLDIAGTAQMSNYYKSFM